MFVVTKMSLFHHKVTFIHSLKFPPQKSTNSQFFFHLSTVKKCVFTSQMLTFFSPQMSNFFTWKSDVSKIYFLAMNVDFVTMKSIFTPYKSISFYFCNILGQIFHLDSPQMKLAFGALKK